ncbi:Xaa-Pro aminopeptidase [Parendozoicomonas haliclonae]|uniref:Xaa-Pro aminopeptidase n=1 Tax=Parendozoicomonas haliclonae TaxID=1960125 RepID=A0A1X7AGJ1_9GAMM|nr:Xaa-Pro aminopeptidase [Parendozoicomonas haliclonae]SMA38943.1 Xaa-Pro aminopeptidase [Parendozoicomonas haliclonae]
MKIAKTTFKARRDELVKNMGEGSVLILPSATEKVRNSDCEYPFRQSSDFWYLTGFGEPESVLVLVPGRKEGEAILFCRRRDPLMETWHGRRAGQEGAVNNFGFDEAFPIDELDKHMPDLLDGRETVLYTAGQDKEFDERLWGWMNNLRRAERMGKVVPPKMQDRDALIHERRLIKSDEEIAVMRAAGEISARAHTRAMKECRAGGMEYQLEASIQHEFAMSGARSPAYTTIVGSGENACILHYTENDCELKDGDLVLIDAGCELDHYAADITRTFPVSGRFSPEQKALYELVLKAQEASFAEIAPGKPWDGFHKAACNVLVEGLIELGLLEGEPEQLIKDGALRDFYMHGTGHWLGMDVHDVGLHKTDGNPIAFQPGMALTVEPGLYIAPDNDKVEARWRGIGIRIEDNLVVTENGYENLTSAAPKTVAEIEALMAASR